MTPKELPGFSASMPAFAILNAPVQPLAGPDAWWAAAGAGAACSLARSLARVGFVVVLAAKVFSSFVNVSTTLDKNGEHRVAVVHQHVRRQRRGCCPEGDGEATGVVALALNRDSMIRSTTRQRERVVADSGENMCWTMRSYDRGQR